MYTYIHTYIHIYMFMSIYTHTPVCVQYMHQLNPILPPQTITLDRVVGWKANDKIVISPTGWDPSHFETFTIASVTTRYTISTSFCTRTVGH